MAPVIQKAGLKILCIKTPKSHRTKYEVSIHDYRHHNRHHNRQQVSGQVLLFDVVLAVGRSSLLMISVRALSGKPSIDEGGLASRVFPLPICVISFRETPYSLIFSLPPKYKTGEIGTHAGIAHHISDSMSPWRFLFSILCTVNERHIHQL